MASGSSNSVRRFAKLRGFADTSGQQYEWKLAALLFLRAVNSGGKFFLASNMSDAGAFDDLVLVIDLHGRTSAHFLQLKHKQDPTRIVGPSALVQPSGNFSLPHLCHTFSQADQQLLATLERDLDVHIDEVHLIIYTNTVVRNDTRGSKVDSILNTDGLIFSFSEVLDADIFTSYEELIDYKTLVHELFDVSHETVDNSEEVVDRINTFQELHGTNRYFPKLKNLKSSPQNKDVLNRLWKEVQNMETITKFRQFMLKLKVFHKQKCQSGLESLILEEFDKCYGVVNQESNDLFKRFLCKVEDWWKTENFYLTEDSPLWEETFHSIVFRLSESKTRELQDMGVRFEESELVPLREALTTHEVVHVVYSGADTSLGALKVHQALGSKCHILVGPDVLKSHRDGVLRAWHSRWCPVLVVQDEPAARELWKPGTRLVLITRECPNCKTELMMQDKLMLDRKNFHPQRREMVQGSLNLHSEPREMVEETLVLNDTCSLQQLDKPSHDKLLDRQLNFQGYPVSLRALVGNDVQLMEEISGDSLTYILKSLGELNVGKPLHDVVNYYIPRTLHRNIHVSKSLLQSEQTNSVFIISSSPAKDLKKILPLCEEICIYENTNNSKYIPCECQYVFVGNCKTEDSFTNICTSDSWRDLHWLHVENDLVRWVRSKGNIDSLYPHIEKEVSSQYQPHTVTDISDRLVLVVAEPGMGKTTLLSSLAKNTKENDTTIWVVRINLNDYTNQLEKLNLGDSESIFHILQSAVIDEEVKTPFEIMLFNHCLKTSGNMIILIDGFDEIYSTYTDKGIDLLTITENTKVRKLWTTSRPVTRELLEAKLACLSFALYSFDVGNQKRFLKNCWGHGVSDEDRLNTLVEEILSLVNRSLGLQGTRLMGIPLLTMMLAESFQSDVKKYCDSNDESVIKLPVHLDIIELYERFVEKKYEIAFKEKAGTDVTKASYNMHFKMLSKMYTENHMVLALVFLLCPGSLRILNCPDIQIKAEQLLKFEDEVEKPGIIIKINNGIPHFLHRTFAEYFAALWFTEHYYRITSFLEIKLFDSTFDIIRKMFDGILTKKYELHSAILNNDLPKVHTLLDGGVDVNTVDLGGRTALHLVVAHKEMHHTIGIIKSLVRCGAVVGTPDLVLRWTPIQYAERVEAWGAVEALLQEHADTEHLSHTRIRIRDTQYLKSLLAVSARNGYLNLLRFMLRHGANINMVVGNNHLTPLHLASCAGHTDIVTCLVQADADLNVTDIDGSTPLHLAAGWGHFTTAQCLVDARANLNKLDIAGCTPLEVADRWCHSDIVSCLVEAGADVKPSDCSTSTALHQAAKDGNECVVREMLNDGADVNISDSDGCTPLHVAARWGHGATVSCLIEAGGNINCTNYNGSTPLYLAAGWDHTETVDTLLLAGADVDLADTASSTPLHQAARWGHTATVRHLLAAGAHPDRRDADGYAALHWAAMRGYANTVTCLVEAGADINMVDSAGASALHLVAAEGHLAIVRSLARAGADINLTDSAGCTPVSLAARLGHINVERYLKSAGASVNGGVEA